MTILKKFYCPEIVEDEVFDLGETGKYFAPPAGGDVCTKLRINYITVLKHVLNTVIHHKNCLW